MIQNIIYLILVSQSITMGKSKKETNKAYCQFLIQKELSTLKKQQKKKQLVSVKKDSKEQVSKLTKQITKSKQKISNYIQILEMMDKNDSSFADKINEEFDSLEQFTQFIEKDLSQNVTIIDLQDKDMKHLIIEDKLPQLKYKNNIYAYHSKAIQEIITDTKYIWKRFQIPQKLITQEQAQNSDLKPNQKQIINKAKRSLQALKQSNGIDLRQCIPQTDVTFKQCINKTIKYYTGIGSNVLNTATTSKDINIITGIRYLIQIIIKNYRTRVIGEPILSKKTLYRNISLSIDLFQLYEKGQIVYFTNITSTSFKDLTSFGYSSDQQGIYHVTYKFTLLDYQKQKQNEFYSGLNMKGISHYPGQQQILICPFQFFKITDIRRGGKIKQIFLEQVEHTQKIKGKAIIQKIQQRAQKKQKKQKFEVNDLKKTLENKKQLAQQNQQKNQQKKKKQIDKMKKKTIQIIEKYDGQISDKCHKKLSDKDKDFTNKILAGILNMTLNNDIKKEIDEYKKMKEQKNKQILNDTQNNDKKFEEQLLKFINITQNNTDNKFEQENAINEIIDHADQSQKVQSKNQLQNYAQEIVQQSIKFQNLISQVHTNSNINNISYVLVLMNEALAKAEMVTILKNTIPKSLYKFYLEKLTIFDANAKVYQFYFDYTPHQNQIKQSITNKFNTKYPSQDQYLKIAFSHDKNISVVTIQSSEDYQSIKQIIVQLNQAKLLHSSCDSKFTNLAYCNQMIDPRGHKNYYIQNFQPQLRGNLVYYFPNQTLRIGLKVYNVFGDNKWLNMSNGPDEWVVAYTSLTKTTLKDQLQSNDNDNKNSKDKYEKISRKSIHCCASFDELIKYIQPININNQQIYIGFQCRVCPQQLQYSDKNSLYYFVDKSQSKSIRPYGIILKTKQQVNKSISPYGIILEKKQQVNKPDNQSDSILFTMFKGLKAFFG